jgi:hypothetical protein
MAGQHVVGGLAGRGEVQRQQGLHGRRAAAEEQHGVVVGNRHQPAQVGLGLGRHWMNSGRGG